MDVFLKPIKVTVFQRTRNKTLLILKDFTAIMSAIQKQIDEGAVPNHVSNVCPKGTKMW